MIGTHLVSLNAVEVEFLLREVLAQATYPFETGKLQFLAMNRVQTKFSVYDI